MLPTRPFSRAIHWIPSLLLLLAAGLAEAMPVKSFLAPQTRDIRVNVEIISGVNFVR